MSDTNSDENRTLREFIEQFIGERLKPKLEEIEKQTKKASTTEEIQALEDKAEKLRDEYSREKWLTSASKRASQIKVATHIPKFTHSSAKASPVYSSGDVKTSYIGTHTLKKVTPDVSGNAAALDVFAFLRCEYMGKSIMTLMEEKDPEIIKALSDDKEQSEALIEGFLSVKEIGSPSSHTLMKQIYFPLKDGGYHLLSPVFPSSLVHYVHEHIRTARFSENTKAAKDARRKGLSAESGYSDYVDTAVMAYGGTKPQNVSQLNSVRGGTNVLLPSLPPEWDKSKAKPIYSQSVFEFLFPNRPYVKKYTSQLDHVLYIPEKNVDIRERRKALVDSIAGELISLPAEIAAVFEPGWSKDSKCRLNSAEKLWLDPPSESDEERFQAYKDGKWCREVAKNFANWLNKRIAKKIKDDKELGESEYLVWMETAEGVLEELLEENSYV